MPLRIPKFLRRGHPVPTPDHAASSYTVGSADPGSINSSDPAIIQPPASTNPTNASQDSSTLRPTTDSLLEDSRYATFVPYLCQCSTSIFSFRVLVVGKVSHASFPIHFTHCKAFAVRGGKIFFDQCSIPRQQPHCASSTSPDLALFDPMHAIENFQ
jgi:hypothetical protein